MTLLKPLSLYRLTALLSLFLLGSLIACQPEPILPTRASAAATVALPAQTADSLAQNPPTWTPDAVPPTITLPPAPPTATSIPTATQAPPTDTPVPVPTNTPVPPATAVPPSDTPPPPPPTEPPPTEPPPTEPPPTEPPPTEPPPTEPPPTAPSEPALGVNILPNPSFEEGHYNQNGIPELQLPNNWLFEWDEGPTGFGNNPWDVYVRPETRVLHASYLPPSEGPLFIWDGMHTVKMFKGSGAISLRLMTDVYLEPGTYVLEINVFPDLVVGYENGQKIWAPDPYSGEVRFIVTGAGTGWFLPVFGQKNTFTHTFIVSQAQTIRVGAGLRGRFALPNNGFFVDDWSLKKVEN
ncbi:MAG: hypothetical protein ACE5G8_16855 [Anaerolineae bacterium]